MVATDAETIAELQELYRCTKSAAAVLKRIAGSVPKVTVEWAKLMRAAFNLSLAQVIPIGGWEPDGTGELKDAQLDKLLVPAIESQRSFWDQRRI